MTLTAVLMFAFLDPNEVSFLLGCWADANGVCLPAQQFLFSEPNLPDPNWMAVRAPALQDWISRCWLKASARTDVVEYLWQPNRFALRDDPNQWRQIQPNVRRIQVWDYNPNGIRVRDIWQRFEPEDKDRDGIINLKDFVEEMRK